MRLPILLSFALLPGLHAAPVYSSAGGGGVTTDLWDQAQGARVIQSTNQHNGAGESDVRQIFGLPSAGAWVEPGHAIFADGPGPGFTDVVEWQTAGWINLTGFELRLSQDGPGSAYRGAGSWRLLASQDGMNFSVVSSGTIPLAPGGMNANAPLLVSDSSLTGITANVRAFRLELVRLTTGGPRVIELDGFGTPGAPPAGGVFLDRLAFNAPSNSLTGRGGAARDDEGPGATADFSVSSRVLGTDTFEDAFGNKNGAVEPESFIFGDGGVPDNGDAIVGNDGETVDFIQWRTLAPVTVAGWQITLSGDGTSSNRDTEMIQLKAGGRVVDCYDTAGTDGTITRMLADGPVTADVFRFECTRTVPWGGRIFAVDAITAQPVTHSGSVALNEVCTENDASLRDEDGDSPDWVELFNNGDAPAALAGWGLSDDATQPFKWTFPAVTLAGREFLTVFLSDKNRSIPGAPLHANFQLKAAGEALFLTRPDGTQHDTVPAVHLYDDVTLGRHPNGSGPWKFLTVPSPGKTNTLFPVWDSLIYDKPAFSVSGGYYAASQTLSLTSTEPDVTIRYTLDGSEPTAASPEFAAPLVLNSKAGLPNVLSMIQGTSTANQHTDGWKPPAGEVRKSTVVRARAFRSDAPDGPVGTQTYFIGADGPRTDGLPVVSLASTPAGLFDYNTGIYMLGRIFDEYVAANPGVPLTGHTPANYTQRGQAWERASHLEWFEPAGTRQFGEPVALDIQGQSTRSFRQKSFGLKARGTAGRDNSIGYALFPGLTKRGSGAPLEKFSHLRLRNFGNDWDYAMMRDSFAHRLVLPAGLDVMASRPVSIMLDGEYWGMLELRENQDGRYFESHYGFDNDEAVILNLYGGVDEGLPDDGLAYSDLLNYCQANSLASPAAYDFVTARADPDNCARYFMSEIWMANADWPQNNIRVWRRRLAAPDAGHGRGLDGRWRWMVFDADLGMAHPWSAGVTENTLAVALAANGRPAVPQWQGTAVFRALMTNDGFRTRFLNLAADMMNSYFHPANATALVNRMESEMLPGMDEHTRRWQPAFGTVAGWQSRVDVIRQFAQQRTAVVRGHFQSQFSLTPAVLTLSVAGGPGRGSISTGGMVVNAALPGASAEVFPWSGTYWRGVPLRLTAMPAPGWQFAGWTGLPDTAAEATLTLTVDAAVTAHFLPDPALPLEPEFLGATNEYRLRFAGTPHASYRLRQSTDLIQWTDAGTLTTDAAGRAETIVSAGPRRRYFRSEPVE